MASVNNTLESAINSLSLESQGTIFETIRQKNVTSNVEGAKECFQLFDTDRDGYLNEAEFGVMLKKLFRKRDGPHNVTNKQCSDILKLLDENQDGQIDLDEFRICWHHWLKQILDPVCALVVVDVQNDFITGTMAIRDCPAGQEGGDVVQIINNMIQNAKFEVVAYSADWHPADHISFIENIHKRKLHHTSKVTSKSAKALDTVVFAGPPIMEQKMWPAHCVQNSWGAKYHQQLQVIEPAIHINKGTNPEIDSYSAFWDNKKLSQTSLLTELTKRGVTDVYVCGLAYDVCVGATAAHALEHGFRTVLVEDACRGVCHDDMQSTHDKLLKNGALVIDSNQVVDTVAAYDRSPELGYQAALNVAMARKLVMEEKKKQSSN